MFFICDQNTVRLCGLLLNEETFSGAAIGTEDKMRNLHQFPSHRDNEKVGTRRKVPRRSRLTRERGGDDEM